MKHALPLIVLLTLACGACERDAPPTPAPAAPAAAPAQVQDPAEARIRDDVRTLAADDMQGREAGTPGYDKAADYVAKRMQAIGLQAAGDGGFFQRVPLLRARRAPDGQVLDIVHADKTVSLRFRDQFLPALGYTRSSAKVEAPAVFVGYGVHAPELQHDDFAGVDLKGKIAVLFNGAPARFDNDRRAFYSSGREKLQALESRGAIGAVFVNTGEDEARSPWSRSSASWNKPGMRLMDAQGNGIDTFPGLQVVATVSAAAADFIFEGGDKLAPQLLAEAKDGSLRAFALPARLSLASNTRIERVVSRNVIGRLPGSDGALAGEHVVYTAHLDHVGIGAAVDGDRIYNGALDNALGVAIMLETARELAASQPAAKRSLLFAAVTAEEKGLLGAQWLATHPPQGVASMVANINLDMPVLLAPSKDVVPIGVEHSSLQGVLDTAAKDVGVDLSPDPFPEEVIFVRSDQYPFIRQGVPAVYLVGGMVSADGKRDPKLANQKFMREHYHQPSDEIDLPIAWGDAARLARLNARIGAIVGNASDAPRWNDGDFFAQRFAEPSRIATGEAPGVGDQTTPGDGDAMKEPAAEDTE